MKEKCFAEKDGKCVILQDNQKTISATSDNCDKCAFFKTREQYAIDRLQFLDKEIAFLKLGATQAERLRNKLEDNLIGGEKNAEE